MVNLSELNLSDNQLAGPLPPEIGLLSQLKLLWLRQNRLTALSDALGSCKRLVELHVGFNQLVTLPEALAGCEALGVIEVRHIRGCL